MLAAKSNHENEERMFIIDQRSGPKPENRYVVSQMTSSEPISPDDDRVKLSETMKKECEGKTIFYNRNVDITTSERELKVGISSVKSNDKSRYFKMFPKTKTSRKRPPCVPEDINVSKIKTFIMLISRHLPFSINSQ